MSLRVYNTLTKQKELFEPVRPGRWGCTCAGRRSTSRRTSGTWSGRSSSTPSSGTCKFKGFEVTWVVNITDVDDKLIDAADRLNTTVPALAEKHTKEYFECLALLGVDGDRPVPQGHGPHGRDHRASARTLIANGHAYAADGNVWFDVAKDADYGKLSHRKVEEQEAGTRETRRRRQAQPRRLRPVEGGQAGRAGVGLALGQGPAGLAHRVLGHEHEIPRPHLRHPRRRHGPDVPAPRERAGPVRERHRPDRSSNTGCTTA